MDKYALEINEHGTMMVSRSEDPTSKWNSGTTLKDGFDSYAEAWDWCSTPEAWLLGYSLGYISIQNMEWCIDLITTRHEGAIEWLRQQGVMAPVKQDNATAEDVTGKIVCGVLPMHLAALTEYFISIDIPNMPADKRALELTAEEMYQYGAYLSIYKVTKM